MECSILPQHRERPQAYFAGHRKGNYRAYRGQPLARPAEHEQTAARTMAKILGEQVPQRLAHNIQTKSQKKGNHGVLCSA